MRVSMLLFITLLALEVHAQKHQGITGQVFWLSGNQMPGPDRVSTPNQGVQREIYIYPVITVQQAQQQGPFFTDFKIEPVAKVMSGPKGMFKIKLPPGEYSVLVKEPQGLFANLFDTQGHINPVIVKERQFTWLAITIDYEAAF